MNDHFEIVLRTIVAFAFLLAVARLLGKRVLSSMTFHDFVTGITIGSMAANFAFNSRISSTFFMVALSVFAFISFVISVVSLRSRKIRKWFAGSPTVLIEDGKILEQNMKHVKFELDSLIQSLREQDVFDIGEVQYAVLENNGKLSVQKKAPFRNATLQDLDSRMPAAVLVPAQVPSAAMQTPPVAENFPIELIMDGEVVEENLDRQGLSRQWLDAELRKRNRRVDEIFYAVISTKGNLVLDYYDDRLKRPVDREGKPSSEDGVKD